MTSVETLLSALATITGHALAVVLSLALSLLAAYVGMDLAGRARRVPDVRTSHLWILAASIAMGSGVWAMHFVGMSAMSYPFEAGFDFVPTAASWGLAVLVCALPLSAGQANAFQSPLFSALCGAATAVGIGSMHFLGESAIATVPAPVYDWRWITAAFILASTMCSVALGVLGRARGASYAQRRSARLKGVALFGLGLSGLHYLTQAGMSYLPGTVCTSQGRINSHALSGSVGVVTMAFLGLMSLVSGLERRAQRVARELNASLANARDQIQRATLSDAATGLPNRLVFQERLANALTRCDASGASLALLRVEIDDFARIVRSLASEPVDDVLRSVAERVRIATGRQCEMASGGGHHFMIFAELPGKPDATVALNMAARILAEMRNPMSIGPQLRLTASVGIALHPGEGGAERLVNNASVALEAAQARGGNGYAFFETGMDNDAHATTAWLEKLRLAIERQEFELHYQPKIHARNAKIAGVEALIRWRHPELGTVSPAMFIPLAERFGLINEIGNWVVLEATRQMAVWCSNGVRMRVAINVSPTQLLQINFADQVGDALKRYGVDPGLLTCEITESGAMRDSDRTMAVFKRLQEIGVQLSIDDFGTGYSSLSHLRKIPLRQLKIDRSFVSELATSADSRSIVSAIVVMAHALRLEVVAEGVETNEQREILVELGCDKLQGFLFAKPMPASALSELMMDIESAREQFRESVFAG